MKGGKNYETHFISFHLLGFLFFTVCACLGGLQAHAHGSLHTTRLTLMLTRLAPSVSTRRQHTRGRARRVRHLRRPRSRRQRRERRRTSPTTTKRLPRPIECRHVPCDIPVLRRKGLLRSSRLPVMLRGAQQRLHRRGISASCTPSLLTHAA